MNIDANDIERRSKRNRSNENFGDNLQLTNWILYLGSICHMTPEVSDLIPGSLEDMDEHIEVADGHHVTGKKTSTNKNV